MSVFSKPFVLCAAFACMMVGGYEINVNGQTYQVNVMNEAGGMHTDSTRMTDDNGQKLATQANAMCSSLRGDSCEQVTNNAAKTHNLFNYFPSRADESVVAFANRKYHANRDESPHLMKAAMDDRTLHYFSRQNPYVLGTVATPSASAASSFATAGAQPVSPEALAHMASLQQTLMDAAGLQSFGVPLQHLGTKKHRLKLHKNKNKNTPATSTSETQTAVDLDAVNGDGEHADEDEEEEYEEIEVALFGVNEELREAMGVDEEEFGDTIDRIVSQLVSSYLDNESDDVDVSQIFASELRMDDGGEVSMQEIDVDDISTQEMNELLQTIAEKYRNGDRDESDVQQLLMSDDVDDDEDMQVEDDEDDNSPEW